MDEDFNTRDATGNLFVFTRKVNSIISEEKICKAALGKVLEFFLEIDEVLGIFRENVQENIFHEIAEEKIMEMVELREKACQEKDWAKADSIREELKERYNDRKQQRWG